MDVPWVVLCEHDREALKLGAAREHSVELAVLRGAMDNPELLQVDEGRSEAGGVRELAEAEPEAAEGGASEEAGGRTPLAFFGPGAVDDDEDLDTLGCEGGEPGVEDVGFRGSEVLGGEAGGGDRPRVGVESGGDGGRSHSSVVEVERSGGPEAAPAGGEGGGAGRVLGGEARDDVAEEQVGEAADAVVVIGGGGGGQGCGGGDRGRRKVGKDGGEGFFHDGG